VHNGIIFKYKLLYFISNSKLLLLFEIGALQKK
jgi:hypothetical protein